MDDALAVGERAIADRKQEPLSARVAAVFSIVASADREAGMPSASQMQIPQ